MKNSRISFYDKNIPTSRIISYVGILIMTILIFSLANSLSNKALAEDINCTIGSKCGDECTQTQRTCCTEGTKIWNGTECVSVTSFSAEKCNAISLDDPYVKWDININGCISDCVDITGTGIPLETKLPTINAFWTSGPQMPDTATNYPLIDKESYIMSYDSNSSDFYYPSAPLRHNSCQWKCDEENWYFWDSKTMTCVKKEICPIEPIIGLDYKQLHYIQPELIVWWWNYNNIDANGNESNCIIPNQFKVNDSLPIIDNKEPITDKTYDYALQEVIACKELERSIAPCYHNICDDSKKITLSIEGIQCPCGNGTSNPEEECDAVYGNNGDGISGCSDTCTFASRKVSIDNMETFCGKPEIDDMPGGSFTESIITSEQQMCETWNWTEKKCATWETRAWQNIKTTMPCYFECIGDTEIWNGEFCVECGNGEIDLGEECDNEKNNGIANAVCTDRCQKAIVERECDLYTINPPYSLFWKDTSENVCVSENIENNTCIEWGEPQDIASYSLGEPNDTTNCYWYCPTGYSNIGNQCVRNETNGDIIDTDVAANTPATNVQNLFLDENIPFWNTYPNLVPSISRADDLDEVIFRFKIPTSGETVQDRRDNDLDEPITLITWKVSGKDKNGNEVALFSTEECFDAGVTTYEAVTKYKKPDSIISCMPSCTEADGMCTECPDLGSAICEAISVTGEDPEVILENPVGINSTTNYAQKVSDFMKDTNGDGDSIDDELLYPKVEFSFAKDVVWNGQKITKVNYQIAFRGSDLKNNINISIPDKTIKVTSEGFAQRIKQAIEVEIEPLKLIPIFNYTIFQQ